MWVDSLGSCSPVDFLLQSLMLATHMWQMCARQAVSTEAWIRDALPVSSLTYIMSCAGPMPSQAVSKQVVERQQSPMYDRLACLINATASAADTPEDVLWQIESFGKVCAWLKVAGDEKADVLGCVLTRRIPDRGECILELGAFVGYSAIRFSKQVSEKRMKLELCSVSMEIDPVHAAISRHHINQAKLSTATEIWVGQLQDTVARVDEVLGDKSLAFIFMDQRGTTFHQDLAQLEGLDVLAPLSHCAADNTLKPGSPIYLWHVAVGATGDFETCLWALSEFASDEIEDWQAVSLLIRRALLETNTIHAVG